MNDIGIIRIRFRIYGVVQGVNFRSSTYREAKRLGLTGFVRNQSDGGVLVEAEGARVVLDELVRYVHDNPGRSTVSKVEAIEIPPIGEKGFLIIR